MARQCTPRVPHYKYGLYGRYIAHDGGYVQNTFSWRGLATPTHTPDPVIAIVIYRKVCPINVMVFRGHTLLLFCTIPYHDAGRVFLMVSVPSDLAGTTHIRRITLLLPKPTTSMRRTSCTSAKARIYYLVLFAIISCFKTSNSK